MPIIPNKEIYDDSKSELPKLIEDLNALIESEKKLIKTNKKLSTSLQKVKKSNDGKEAKALADGTDKLTKSTKKLKDAYTAEERVKQQILRANAKLSESRSKSAKDLALVRQKTLEQNKALREQAKAQLGVKKSTNGLITSFKNLGKQLIGGLGIAAGIGLVVSQLKKMAERSNTLIKSVNKLKGTFDITTKEAKKLASQINAIAVNIEGVDAKNLEQSLIAIVKTFDDLSEQEALDLIQEGFAKGSNNSGEFLDILKEYPVQFKAAGIDAKTMFAIINQQVKQGIYSDKGVDAIKEGGLRLRENTIAVQRALKPFDDYTKQQIKLAIESGNSFEAIQLVSKGLVDTSLTAQETQTIIADVFGGAGEDAGLEYIKTLADIETNLNDVANEISIVTQANIALSESYNKFILSVEDGKGTISTAIASLTDMGTEFFNTATIFNEADIGTKLKIIANAALNLFEKAFLPLVRVLRLLGVEVPKFRFEIEETTKELDKNTESLDKNKKAIVKEEEEVVKLTAAQIKANEKLAENNRLRAEAEIIANRQKDLVPEIESKTGKVELTALQKLEDDKALIRENARVKQAEAEEEAHEKALQRAQDIEDAKLAIQEQAITSGQQLASDIFSSFQDERLAKINSEAEAEKAILQQRLDDGIISEEQFSKQVQAIEQKQRIASAKAEKKKAIFDIAIAGIVASIKALPNLIASAAILVVAGIQAGVVAAKPIPTLAEGEVNINAPSHAKGGKLVEIEGGESYINKQATAQSEGILNMVNDGIITDKNLPQMTKQNDNMLVAGLLMKGNKNSSDMIELLSRLGIVIPRGNENWVERADGSIERLIR